MERVFRSNVLLKRQFDRSTKAHLHSKELLLEVDLGQYNDKTTTDEEAFDDIRSFVELDKPKFVLPRRCEMTKHFAKLVGPSIITTVSSYIIMTINSVYAGQFVEDSATKLAGFGLGTMILSMICRNPFLQRQEKN